MKIEYLIFNLVIFFASSFGVLTYPGAKWPKFGYAMLAILTLGIPYVIWDMLVTNWWWSFNTLYTLDFRVEGLPLEELLFFMVIPWSCLIIWENLKTRLSGATKQSVWLYILTPTLILGIWGYIQKAWYSLVISGLVTGFTIIVHKKSNWLKQKSLLFFLGIVIIFTIVFNGYLTSRPIVIYNSEVLSNIRIGTVPIEDILYGLVLVTGVTILYEFTLRSRHIHKFKKLIKYLFSHS